MELVEMLIEITHTMFYFAGYMFASVGLINLIISLIVAFNVFRLLIVPLTGHALETGVSDSVRKWRKGKEDRKRERRVKRAGRRVRRPKMKE